MGRDEHRKNAPPSVSLAIISVSSTRNLSDDKSGHWIRKEAVREGHEVVFHQVLPDDAETIRRFLTEVLDTLAPRAVLITGGTGIAPKDVTIEAVRPLFEKELAAFGAIFAQLSYEEIDSAALLSRATAGIVAGAVIFCMPGSLKACRLACRELIFPELGHLVGHLVAG